MSGLSFILTLTILFLIMFLRFKITNLINENFSLNSKFQSEWIVYALTVFFIIVIAMGMLMDNTKSKYGQVSEGFQNLKPKKDTRPNPLFDINTYW